MTQNYQPNHTIHTQNKQGPTSQANPDTTKVAVEAPVRWNEGEESWGLTEREREIVPATGRERRRPVRVERGRTVAGRSAASGAGDRASAGGEEGEREMEGRAKSEEEREHKGSTAVSSPWI